MRLCRGMLVVLLFSMLIPQFVYAEGQTVRYQAENNYPPYRYVHDGYQTGFDVDLINLIFSDRTYDLKISDDSWENVYNRLKNGEIDTCGTLAIMPERENDVLYTKPILTIHTAIYTMKSFKQKLSVGDLGKYRIGVIQNHYAEYLLKSKVQIPQYETYSNIDEAMTALSEERIDVLFESQEIMNHILTVREMKSKIIVQQQDLYPVKAAFGISKTRPDLVEYINQRMDDLKKKGIFEELYEKYFFSHSDDYKNSRIRNCFLLVLFIAGSVLLGFILLKLYISRLQKKLWEEQNLLKDILNHSNLFIWAVDLDGTTVKFNRHAETITGLTEGQMLGRKLDAEKKIQDEYGFMVLMLQSAIHNKLVENKEICLLSSDQGKRCFLFRTSIIFGIEGRPDIFMLSGMDISERKDYEVKLQQSYQELEATYEELTAAEEELKQQLEELTASEDKLRLSEERFRLAAEGSNDILWDIDMVSMTSYNSDRWYGVMGYTRNEIEELKGDWRKLLHPQDSEAAENAIQQYLSRSAPYFNCEFRLKAKNGEYRWFHARGKALFDNKGTCTRFAGSLTDISERKDSEVRLQNSYQELEATYEELSATQEELKSQYDRLIDQQHELTMAQEKLHHQAYYDSLSDLPNRLFLTEELSMLVKNGSASNAAVYFLDADNFKYINDTLGHPYGDQLIKKMSERLSRVKGRDDLLFRLGGDEFVLLKRQYKDSEEVTGYADRLLDTFKESFVIEESKQYVSISIGISLFPQDGSNAEELLKNADIAMYRAKEEGKGKHILYHSSMHNAVHERMRIEKYLRNALQMNEFILYYQPQLHIGTSSISGFEALIRWNSPELGMVSPLSFIRIAEDSRLIIPIGEWVLKTACEFLKELHRNGYSELTISVNISVIQLLQEDFVGKVFDILDETGIAPQFLEIEITESIFMDSSENIIRKLETLREKGIRIALDDFGTGYSSLSYLKQLPISTLKVDKTFIDYVPDLSDNESLTSSILMIGKKLGLQVVAEGVETEPQYAYLQERQCDRIQGYWISRPIPQAQVMDFLNRGGE